MSVKELSDTTEREIVHVDLAPERMDVLIHITPRARMNVLMSLPPVFV